MKLYDIIKGPIITEKSMDLKETFNKYTFKVDKKANKLEIKNAIQTIFNVKVTDVHTINVLPKKRTVGRHSGFKPAYKKAICTLAEGNSIDEFNI